MEENLEMVLISDGSWSFLWDRPLTLIIMLLIFSIVGWQMYKSFGPKYLNNVILSHIIVFLSFFFNSMV